MRAHGLLVYSLTALGLLGLWSCSGSQNHAPGTDAANSAREAPRNERIERIPQVDLSSMTDAERTLWVDLVNDQLSPCGEPVSVARCATEQRGCGACVTATRYLARLVTEGYDRAALTEQYRVRFGSEKLNLPTEDSPSRGAPMARVTLVEFSDFQCPHCGAAHPELVRLLREFDGRVRLVYKYFPLSSHTRALPAARAAEAARAQGKFWEMHDLLFQHQSELEDADILRYAREIGLDIERFEQDWAAPSSATRVEADRQLGMSVGIEATPSIFVDGRPFRESLRNLPAYIKEELDL
jgi:protein-disulfide isomerase